MDRLKRPIVAAESVTALGPAVRGAVLVAGSHGGLIASYLGASAGAHALILNDAGVGLDGAGIAGLTYLDAIGIAAATVAHTSARIGDGEDALGRGVISHANRGARKRGVTPGMRCRDAAELLREGTVRTGEPTTYTEARFLLERPARGPEVWGLDSIGKVVDADAARILVIGSHGALHGGRPESALPVAAAGAIFHDAGIGIDGAGVTRLPVLAARGMPAAVVAAASARIGDARSMWETGRLSGVNSVAAAQGIAPGMSVRAGVARLRAV